MIAGDTEKAILQKVLEHLKADLIHRGVTSQ